MSSRDAATGSRTGRRATLIVNAMSRRGQRLFDEACHKLRDAGVVLDDAIAVRDPSKMDGEVKAAIARGTPMVIIGGGDGSISETVDHFVGHDTAYAVLPLGTANSFARTLGLPLDMDSAVEVIARGAVRRIDLGKLNDDYFANVAGIGMPSLIGSTIPHGFKRVLGRPGYVIWAAWCLLRFRPFDVVLTEKGQAPRRFRAVEIRIANGRFLGGTKIADDVQLASGDITIQVVTGGGRIGLMWNWLATTLRLPARQQAVESIRVTDARLETSPALPISVDGEVKMKTPVNVCAASGAICVVVPPDGDGRADQTAWGG